MQDLIDSIRSTDDSTSSVGEATDISDSAESTCTDNNLYEIICGMLLMMMKESTRFFSNHYIINKLRE